jgi:hypothetical protein
MVKAIRTNPRKAADLCRLRNAHRENLGAGDADAICAAFSAPPEQADQACAAAAAAFKRLGKPCLSQHRVLWGTETNCASMEAAEEAATCQASALYRKAYDSKNPEACGKSAECRAAMTGNSAGLCTALANDFKTAYCQQVGQRVGKMDLKGIAQFRARRKADYEQQLKTAERHHQEQVANLTNAAREKIQTSCQSLMTQTQAAMTRAFDVVNGIEPHSLPEFSEARERLGDMTERFHQVTTSMTTRATKTRGAAPEPVKSSPGTPAPKNP